MTTRSTSSDHSQLAARVLDAISPHDTLYGRLQNALTLAESLTQLIGDHCEWSTMPRMGEPPCPHQLHAAARLIEQQISIARVIAEHLHVGTEAQA